MRPLNALGLSRRLAYLAVFGAAGCGPPPAAPAMLLAPGRIHYAPTSSSTGRVVPALASVRYDGGPVLVDPKMYLIFWGYKRYGDPDKVRALLVLYAKNMGGSSHDNIETQYYEVVSASTIYITNPKGQLGGVWSDDSAVPKSPTDQDVSSEALKSVAHFGYDPNGLYVVATPTGHSTEGFGTNWCAYHSYTFYESSKLLAYDDFPYMPDVSDCGKNEIKPPSDETATDEGVTIMAGHEYGEAITDPEPYTGWNGVSGEIGDYCAWHNIANDKFGKRSYTSQPMLSNKTESCVQGYK
jgi:hypothetical protein